MLPIFLPFYLSFHQGLQREFTTHAFLDLYFLENPSPTLEESMFGAILLRLTVSASGWFLFPYSKQVRAEVLETLRQPVVEQDPQL